VEQEHGESLELVLRMDTGDGPLSGSELCLAREGVLYRELADTEVRIPRLIGATDSGNALLLERVRGSEEFETVTDDLLRSAIIDDFLVSIATLHKLDVKDLTLPGFERPRNGPDHARCDLGLWRRIFTGLVADRPPFLVFAFEWLDRNPPKSVERTALCHGDAGRGNFLFEGARVTALLDWEFAHLGDPLDDLAWIAVRSHLLGEFGDLAANFRRWADLTGLPVNPERVEYYRAMVMTRMATSCLVAIGHGDSGKGRKMDTRVHRGLLPYLEYLIPQSMAVLASREDRDLVESFVRKGEQKVAESPILSEIARPLDTLELS
jgi:aminoglycoside phosphotransferase (APT) family kinase protein